MLELREEFAARLRVLVADSGLSKAELARRAGIKPPAIYPIVSGKRRPNAKQLGGLAHELCVDLLDFIGVDDHTDERDALARQLERTRQRAAQLEQELTTQTREHEQLEERCAEAERIGAAQLSALESELAEQRAAWTTKLAEQQREAHGRVADLERQLAAQTRRTQRAAAARNEHERARSAEAEEATAKLTSLEEQLNAARASAREQEAECTQLRKELQRWTTLGGFAAGKAGWDQKVGGEGRAVYFEEVGRGQLVPEIEKVRLVSSLSSLTGILGYGLYQLFSRKR